MHQVYVEIELFATLKKYTPENADACPVFPGKTVEELITELKIPKDKVKLVFINHRKASLETRLRGGERVGIFPPVGGG